VCDNQNQTTNNWLPTQLFSLICNREQVIFMVTIADTGMMVVINESEVE